MAALIAVGVGMGAEKLGRKISEKRLERKEQKAAKVLSNIVFAEFGANYTYRSERQSMVKAKHHPQVRLIPRLRDGRKCKRERVRKHDGRRNRLMSDVAV